MTETFRVVIGGIFGALAGFLTRPCCFIPAALSLAGVSSAGLAHAAVAYRPAFVSFSAVMLTVSLWMAFQRDGGWLTKLLTAGATILALSAALMGVV